MKFWERCLFTHNMQDAFAYYPGHKGVVLPPRTIRIRHMHVTINALSHKIKIAIWGTFLRWCTFTTAAPPRESGGNHAGILVLEKRHTKCSQTRGGSVPTTRQPGFSSASRPAPVLRRPSFNPAARCRPMPPGYFRCRRTARIHITPSASPRHLRLLWVSCRGLIRLPCGPPLYLRAV